MSVIRKQNETERKIQVLVIDAIPSVVEGIRHMLEIDGQFAVIGFTEVHVAIKELASRRFDCVIIDADYPDIAHSIRRVSAYQTMTLVHTANDPSPYFNLMVEAGAMGFISKTSTGELLREELKRALSGHSWVPVQLLRELRRSVAYIDCGQGVKREAITDREERILHYLSLGYTQRETAESLYVSQRSIEKAICDLYRKFGVASRKDLLRKARQAKLLPQEVRGGERESGSEMMTYK